MSTKPIDAEVVEEILKAIQELKFGVVEVIIHEGRVTEIRQTRRRRLEGGKPA